MEIYLSDYDSTDADTVNQTAVYYLMTRKN